MAEDIDPTHVSQMGESVTGLRTLQVTDKVWQEMLKTQGIQARNLRLYADKQGRYWHRIAEGRCGPGQMLFARLFKSIIPVCDVVKSYVRDAGGSPYLSLVTPIDRVKNTVSSDQLRGMRMILRTVFKDMDRGPSNVNLHGTGDTFLMFDFETLPIFFMEPTVNGRTDTFFTNRMETMMKRNGGLEYWDKELRPLDELYLESLLEADGGLSSRAVTRNTLDQMIRVIEAFQAKIMDKEHIFAIAKSLPVPLHEAIYFPPSIECGTQECYFEAFYAKLVSRINDALAVVREARADA